MRVIGLTGGIATGKSSVSSIIEQENVPVIDCDKIAHAVVKKACHRTVPTLTCAFRSVRKPHASIVTIEMKAALCWQGRWGYRRVVKEFGQEILRPDGAPHVSVNAERQQ